MMNLNCKLKHLTVVPVHHKVYNSEGGRMYLSLEERTEHNTIFVELHKSGSINVSTKEDMSYHEFKFTRRKCEKICSFPYITRCRPNVSFRMKLQFAAYQT